MHAIGILLVLLVIIDRIDFGTGVEPNFLDDRTLSDYFDEEEDDEGFRLAFDQTRSIVPWMMDMTDGSGEMILHDDLSSLYSNLSVIAETLVRFFFHRY